MKSSSKNNHYRFHNLGLGDIQLGRMPGQIPGMLPFKHFIGRQHFTVTPHAGLYHVFNGQISGTIEQKDKGIDLRHVFAGVNEYGFINRLFLYPMYAGFQLATRLSQLYGEPRHQEEDNEVSTHNSWVTDSETEITLHCPVTNAVLHTVIAFRFLYDVSALRDYAVRLSTHSA